MTTLLGEVFPLWVLCWSGRVGYGYTLTVQVGRSCGCRVLREVVTVWVHFFASGQVNRHSTTRLGRRVELRDADVCLSFVHACMALTRHPAQSP